MPAEFLPDFLHIPQFLNWNTLFFEKIQGQALALETFQFYRVQSYLEKLEKFSTKQMKRCETTVLSQTFCLQRYNNYPQLIFYF